MKTAEQPAGTSRFWSALICLILCASLATIAVSWLAGRTQEKIAANQLAWETQIIATVLPPGTFDNEPSLDAISVIDEELLGTREPLMVYRARRNGKVAATVVTAVAQEGYVGPIRLLVGISYDSSIIAVRAIEHRETPGLGDQIDINKSEWIDVFSHSSGFENSLDWELKRDGGKIDRITGATVTSRAVINAVRNALEFYRRNQTDLHAISAGNALNQPD